MYLNGQTMPHTISYNPATRFIEAEYQGDIFFDEIKEAASQFAQLARENTCNKILSDFREANNKLTTAEIYGLPKLLYEKFWYQHAAGAPIWRALVVKKDLADFHFFETISQNNALQTKVFTDMNEARQWLSAWQQ